MMKLLRQVKAFVVGLAGLVALANPARADTDSIEGPWGTVHGDLSGTAATTGINYTLGAGPVEEKWRLDVIAEGHDRPAGRASITFDRDGNLYWITNNGGGTGGVVRLVSATPAGAIRWFGNDGAGAVHALGTRFGGASPVVGEARVYAIGDRNDMLFAAAYDKATGRTLWDVELAPSLANEAGKMLTPALYRGKLYVVGVSEGRSQDVHSVDAETGNVDWTSSIAEVAISNAVVGQMAFVPEGFGPGIHGIYFNGDSNNGGDGMGEVYGIQIHADEALFGWASDGGKAARSHVIYSEADNLLYTLTWSDYGAQLYAFDPAAGLVTAYQNSKNTGHGFYDVGALDFDGETLIAGGFEGYILRYTKSREGAVFSDEEVFKGGSTLDSRFWGETRVIGQLVQDGTSNTILITATNSLMGCGSHVVAVDVTQRKLLWEYDTGNIWDHQFLYAGGPVMGPDGKVYYFARFNPATLQPEDPPTVLVALGAAASEPEPTAGLIMVGYQNREIRGIEPDQCIRTGEVIRCDASGSTGKDRTYAYAVEPPDDVTIEHSGPTDPFATLRFHFAETYTIRLTVQNSAGTAEYTQVVCVTDSAPVCSFVVTDENGGPIDSADNDDLIPCLPAGGTAVVDAGLSFGGNLVYELVVTPSDGTDIDQPDNREPGARISFANAGTYDIVVKTTNDLGTADCTPITICVVPPLGGIQRPGDMDQDGKVSLTDAVRLLSHLFLGTFPTLPCEGRTATDPGAGELALLDVNGSSRIDLSDGVYVLNYLFTGSNGPPVLGADCIAIAGCPDNSGACFAE